MRKHYILVYADFYYEWEVLEAECNDEQFNVIVSAYKSLYAGADVSIDALCESLDVPLVIYSSECGDRMPDVKFDVELSSDDFDLDD